MTCEQSTAPSPQNHDRASASSEIKDNHQEESSTDSDVLLTANGPNFCKQTIASDADFDGETDWGNSKQQGSAEGNLHSQNLEESPSRSRNTNSLFADMLPKEILGMILESLLVSSLKFFIHCSQYRETEPGNCLFHPEILRTCKRIHNKGRQVLYGMNTFLVRYEFLQDVSRHFFCNIGSTNRSLMKNLIIEDVFWMRREKGRLSGLVGLFEDRIRLRNLKSVGIGIDLRVWSPIEVEDVWGPSNDDLSQPKTTKADRVGADAVRSLVLSAAASTRGSIPEMQHVSELKSGFKRKIFFSRLPLGARKDDKDKYWLPCKSKACRQGDGIERTDLDVDVGNMSIKRATESKAKWCM